MKEEVFEEQVKSHVKHQTISPGQDRASLDWEYIGRMREVTTDFIQLFKWIAKCVETKMPLSFDDFSRYK